MDTYRILLDGTEVARLTGEGLEHGRKTKGDAFSSEVVEDPKLIKKVVHGQSIFVLMASSQKNVSVEKVVDDVSKD